jgi:hypothetical protein
MACWQPQQHRPWVACQPLLDSFCLMNTVIIHDVELYQEGASEEQIRRLLNLDTRFEVHALLKRHGVPLRYTLQDLEDDRDTLRRLGL